MAARPVIKKPLDPIVNAAQDDFDETLAYVRDKEVIDANNAVVGELLPPETKPTFDLVLFHDFSYSLQGTSLITDLSAQTKKARALNELYISKEPESDDEIAHRANQVKAIKEGRAEFKDFRQRVKGEFVTLAEFESMADAFDAIMQNTQSIGEDQVKNFKARKVADIKTRYQNIWNAEILRLRNLVTPLTLSVVAPDFEKAFYRKKEFSTMESAAKDQVAFCLTLAERVATVFQEKLKLIREQQFQFLFPDLQQLCDMDIAALKDEFDFRIAGHIKAEAEKAEDLRIKIAAEEKAKAEKLKLAELQKAQDARLKAQAQAAKAEREAKAKADLESAAQLREYAQRIHESAQRAESSATVRKEELQANVMLQQAAKLEAEAPKKLETPKPKTDYALQEVTKFLQNKFFLDLDESYQLIGELWDAIEKIWHDESKNL